MNVLFKKVSFNVTPRANVPVEPQSHYEGYLNASGPDSKYITNYLDVNEH